MAFDKVKTIRAAEKYLAQGKIPAAIQEYQRIVELDADDFSALNTLGDLYARVDKKQEAIACYRRVAEHYREQGFTLKAIAMFKKLTRFVPEDHQTALALAALYEQQGLMVEARAQYLVAADAYARAGNTRQALEVLRRIADLDPSNTHIRLRLAESYAGEKLPDLAAEAYTNAGERLAARKEFEQSLDAFTKALALKPASHAALAGLLSAHIALGTADEAAEVLEQAVEDRPGDIEVRAMLARAYVETEDAMKAERATQALVERDPSSFTLFFDVIRLHLRQGYGDGAVRLLGWIIEPVITGRQEEVFTELLQEVLARNPEQMDAHRLLVHAYTALHDEARLRPALERLAEAAEATGDAEEERRALSRLTRLAPDEAGYQTRLEELGGLHPDEEAARAAAEVPTFESFMLGDDAAHASAGESAPENASVSEFEWNSVSAPAHDAANAGSSFADLNDLTDAGPPPPPGFQEFDFGSQMGEAGGEQAQSGSTAAAERMLLQELESVDFYIEQGYTDIARDTLDMLEGQYGPHPDISARRGRLLSAGASAANANANAPAPEVAPDAASADDFSMGDLFVEAQQVVADKQQPAAERPAGGGLDPGLAAVFDEFREAVEDSAAGDGADFDTHYQMGIAYREMGLLDQAVEEFQTAIGMIAQGDGTPRYLQCCNMLGHCFIEKDMPRPAATWFKKGLAAPGHTEDEYQAMRYDLGTAYERMGDTERAIEVLSEVYAIDVSYRGVAERLRDLQKERG
ncbi:MAG TPA: tetratricopeptide repeat protein [Pyrinomonadaceae bacterium]|nr:tetratricopeptide repeat protein [Pyrinomonadaceae bacterium]